MHETKKPGPQQSQVTCVLLWNKKKKKVTGVLVWSNGVYISSIESTPFRRLSRSYILCKFFFYFVTICDKVKINTLEMIYSTLCGKSKMSVIIICAYVNGQICNITLSAECPFTDPVRFSPILTSIFACV